MRDASIDNKIIFLREIVKVIEKNVSGLDGRSCNVIELRKALAGMSDKEFQNIIEYLIRFNYVAEDDNRFTITTKGFYCINPRSLITQLLNTDTVSLCLLKK